METTESDFENYVNTNLHLIVEKLPEEEYDIILDERDCDTFSQQWIQVYNAVEQLKVQMGISATYNEDIRRKTFCTVLNITGNDDLAAYISDDLGLIMDAIKVDANDSWINTLWQSYKNGIIPKEV